MLESDEWRVIVLVVSIYAVFVNVDSHRKVSQAATLILLWTVVRRELLLHGLVDHADLGKAL